MRSSKRTLVVRRVGARPHVIRIGKPGASPMARQRPDLRREVLEHDGTRPIRPTERGD